MTFTRFSIFLFPTILLFAFTVHSGHAQRPATRTLKNAPTAKKAVRGTSLRPTRTSKIKTIAKGAVLRAKQGSPTVFKSPYVRPPSVKKLLGAYRARLKRGQGPRDSQEVQFSGVGKRDVYNPTAPFVIGGRTVMAARVESRKSETDSQVVFFAKSGNKWAALKDAPTFAMQDPFVTQIKGQTIIGGVETSEGANGSLTYKTVFYRGRDLTKLERFAEGPVGMKDIRLAPYGDKILVLTRPQGETGGRGQIGMTVVNSLGELTAQAIGNAPIIQSQFRSAEWGGANEVRPLGGSLFGVLGHIASFDAAGGRHYYPIAFTVDAATGGVSPHRILLERADLPGGTSGVSKRSDLRDVLFSGGLSRDNTLYVGAGDARVYRAKISDPFADVRPPKRAAVSL